ncbi:MAG: glycosyltransferase family 39 protein, partial [Rhizobiales bacterium]|nr:glycosyltransferase family 39 protein [Hyphomicrobiales bacterium]
MHPNVDSRSRSGWLLDRRDLFDLIALVLIAALLGLALLTFQHYSISNDEAVQNRYGEMILAYYRSGLTDQSLFNFQNLYLYGGLFDVLALLLGHVLPGDIYTIRHVLCAVIGVGGIAATWATARTIAGPRAGALAALSLAVCGVWYGPMFNHTKDIPFAAAMIGATYFLLRAVRGLPRASLADLICFGMLLGAALGQRALGLLMIAYAAFAIALYTPRELTPAAAVRFLGRSLVRFGPAFVLGYVIMVASWPWSAIRPFNAVRAVFAFTHFAYPIETLLAGHTYLMAQVPRSYEPVYLAIKLPLVILFGAALTPFAIVAARRSSALADRLRARETGFVAFTAVLPVLLHVASHGPAFTGMRHF